VVYPEKDAHLAIVAVIENYLTGYTAAMDIDFATQLILEYKYLLMIPVAVVEGPVLSMISGVLLRLGQLSIIPTFAALAVGDLLGDAMWYWLGRRYGYSFVSRFGKYFSVTREHVETVRELFHVYHVRILLVSKVTMGIGFPAATLFTAGLSHIPFWKFMGLNALGQIVWTGLLLGIGFFLGNLYMNVNNIIGILSIAGMMGFFLLALYGFGRYLGNRLKQAL